MSYRPITDVWVMARPKVKYYGAYPAGFLERARALLGVTINDPVLHLCAGKVRDYPYPKRAVGPNDGTVDLDPACDPDFVMDVRKLGVEKGDLFPVPTTTVIADSVGADAPYFDGRPGRYWGAALIDRPYTAEDAAHYAPGSDALPEANDLLKRALSVVRPGGRVGMLDYFVPRPPKTVGGDEIKFVAVVAVMVGFGNRMRAYTVFERVAQHETAPAKGVALPTGDPDVDDTLNLPFEEESGLPPEVPCLFCAHVGMHHDHRTKKCAECQDCPGYEAEPAEVPDPRTQCNSPGCGKQLVEGEYMVCTEHLGPSAAVATVEVPVCPECEAPVTKANSIEGEDGFRRHGSCHRGKLMGLSDPAKFCQEHVVSVDEGVDGRYRLGECPQCRALNLCRVCWNARPNLPEPPQSMQPEPEAKCDVCSQLSTLMNVGKVYDIAVSCDHQLVVGCEDTCPCPPDCGCHPCPGPASLVQPTPEQVRVLDAKVHDILTASDPALDGF